MNSFVSERSSRWGRVRRIVTALVALVATTIAVDPPLVSAAAVAQSLTASVSGAGSVLVTWNQPTGAAEGDYSYKVYWRTGSGGWSSEGVGAGVESYTITGLTGGTTYEVRVTSSPSSGAYFGTEGADKTDGTLTSFSGAPTTTVVAASLPSAPTIGSPTAGDGQITVAHSPGATNGSSVIGYRATCTPTGDGVAKTSSDSLSSSLVVTGLTNGTSYTCSVIAISTLGNSTASASTPSTTPAAAPSTPTGVAVSTASQQLTVTWSAATSNGSALTGYTVQLRTASGGGGSEIATQTVAGNVLTYTFSTGITNGTTYHARVLATNALGSSPYSTSVSGTPALGSFTIFAQPSGVTSGVAFNPVVAVNAQGAGVAITVTASGGATVSAGGTATTGGAPNYRATFNGLTVSLPAGGTGIVLTFSANGYNDVTSNPFNITGTGSSTTSTTSSTSSTSTTVAQTTPRPGLTTTTTVRASGTTTTTTTAVAASVIIVPPRLGTEVSSLPPAPSRVAEDATVAVKPKTLTVLIDPPDLPKARAITKYVVTVTPVGGGKPITRTITVSGNDMVLKPQFTNLGGRYKVSVSAVNAKGRTVGTWTTKTIVVKKG